MNKYFLLFIAQQEFPDTNELIIVEMKKNKVWLSNEKCENIWLFLKMTVWSEVYNAHKNNTCTWNCKRQPYSEKGGVKGGGGGGNSTTKTRLYFYICAMTIV